MLAIWYNYCVQVFKLASLILLITVFKKRGKNPTWFIYSAAELLTQNSSPVLSSFFFSLSIIEAVGLFSTNYCVSLRWTPFNSQGFVKGGAVNVPARLQLCCGFSLLNIMLLFRLDRRDFFFFLLRQSSLVAKWFKQLHCGEAQRSYYCVCVRGVGRRGRYSAAVDADCWLAICQRGRRKKWQLQQGVQEVVCRDA